MGQDTELFDEAFTENISNNQKVKIYLDSIDKYLYRNVDISKQVLGAVEKILVDDVAGIDDSLSFAYTINKALYQHNMRDPLGAYKTLLDYNEIRSTEEFSSKEKLRFGYLEAYTFMELGDLEAAQNQFYNNITISKLEKDTSAIISNLYSLGQLFSDTKLYSDAEECYKELFELDKEYVIRPSTRVLLHIEMAENLIGSQQFQRALTYVDKGQALAKSNELNVLEIQLLFLKIDILLEQNKTKEAQEILAKIRKHESTSYDKENAINLLRSTSVVELNKGNYKKAEAIQLQILELIDSTDLISKRSAYQSLHKASNLAGKHKQAYAYLQDYNTYNNQLLENQKRQKTDYLKFKFDSEQKLKENQLLSSELKKNKAQKNLLYAIISLIILLLVFLGSAYDQKKVYSKRLEEEVKARTDSLEKTNEDLKKTNEELDEINNILSHDIKEPLRSIVSFSQLAISKMPDNLEKSKEYVNIVENSGQQLSHLIEDVNEFRSVSSIVPNKIKRLDFNKIIVEILDGLRDNYPEKKILLTMHKLPILYNSPNIIYKIFSELLDNAIKFNTNQEVTLQVDHLKKGGSHQFLITDNGIGMEEVYHQQVFKMFSRLNNRQQYSGSGLGLNMVVKLADKIGGHLTLLESDLDAGSTFILELPHKNPLSQKDLTDQHDQGQRAS